jgi:hypothetical protein
MSNKVKETKERKIFDKMKPVTNYMGGTSYKMNPIDTLKMVTASSIFGEPQYYRDGEFAQKGVRDGITVIDRIFAKYSIIPQEFGGMKTSEFMEEIIDEALEYDFEATIRWAKVLREEFFMRLNPQVIMVRAAMHPNRVAFNEKNPGVFSEINDKVMARADEPASQLTYYIYRNDGIANVPNVLKRNWAKRLERASRYDIAKYKNSAIGMIDTVRVCHANSPILDELMSTGTVKFEENNQTWEVLRSSGMGWEEILKKCNVPHMALLRNLRGIFKEIDNRELCADVLKKLENGVAKGKQFPFRYWSAYKAVEKDAGVNHKPLILDSLERCMDASCANLPTMKGKTMCLTDNSGSAWGTFNSEYGSVTVAEIDNLSSIIAAKNSEEGYVGKFGDKLLEMHVSKRDGLLSQLDKLQKLGSVGGATENGIWLFLDRAIRQKEHWDNIFIFSDMQAGHGGLYGTSKDCAVYSKKGYSVNGRYIDVAKLIDVYRRKVNPKVNVISVQTAGYNNVVIPEMAYRSALLYGWTGKEVSYASEISRQWDEIDAKMQKK